MSTTETYWIFTSALLTLGGCLVSVRERVFAAFDRFERRSKIAYYVCQVARIARDVAIMFIAAEFARLALELPSNDNTFFLDSNSVVIELNETGTNTLETAATNVAAQVASDLSAVAATVGATAVSITGAQPGFYYSVVYDNNLRTLSSTAAIESDRALANAEGSVELRMPAKKVNATAGFYRVKVSVKAED